MQKPIFASKLIVFFDKNNKSRYYHFKLEKHACCSRIFIKRNAICIKVNDFKSEIVLRMLDALLLKHVISAAAHRSKLSLVSNVLNIHWSVSKYLPVWHHLSVVKHSEISKYKIVHMRNEIIKHSVIIVMDDNASIFLT